MDYLDLGLIAWALQWTLQMDYEAVSQIEVKDLDWCDRPQMAVRRNRRVEYAAPRLDCCQMISIYMKVRLYSKYAYIIHSIARTETNGEFPLPAGRC